MYLYISFLRPPPVQAHPSKPLFITPQIANDLRTEPYDHEQDIYYSWVSSDQPIIHTVPLKLTTWRPSHAYKEIPLPAPPRVKPGQSWSLFLCSEKWTDEQPGVIDLASSCGSPFPVKSMPIFFTVNPTSRKQGNIERTYRLPSKAAGEYHRFTLREQTSFDLDKKVWDSGIGLSCWLTWLSQVNADTPSVTDLRDILFSAGRRVLELGAGTGIVSLALSFLCNGCRIISTDLPSAIPLLSHNLDAHSEFTTCKVTAAVLDWDAPIPPEVLSSGPFDLVVMADVTYNTSAFPSLAQTLGRLLAVSPPPLFLIGYKERDASERVFWDIIRDIGLASEKLGEQAGCGGAPVEIWLARAT